MKRHAIPFVLAFCVTAAPAAMAQSDLGLKDIGATVGVVSPENLGSTFGLGLFANWGTIAPRIGLESRLDYWSHSDNAFGFESSIRDIALSARGKYFFQVAGTSLRPFAGGGLGLHFLRSKVSTPIFFGVPSTSSSASDTKVGVDLGGGFSSPLNPRTDLVGEAWYGIVTDVSQLALRVGLSYRIGP